MDRAREANIYSMQVLGNNSNTGTPVPDLLIFDYLRAFHRNKAINPDTGIKNQPLQIIVGVIVMIFLQF